MIPKPTCAYQWVRNVSFPEHFVNVLNKWLSTVKCLLQISWTLCDPLPFSYFFLFSYFFISYMKTSFFAKNDPKKWIDEIGLGIMVVFIS